MLRAGDTVDSRTLSFLELVEPMAAVSFASAALWCLLHGAFLPAILLNAALIVLVGHYVLGRNPTVVGPTLLTSTEAPFDVQAWSFDYSIR